MQQICPAKIWANLCARKRRNHQCEKYGTPLRSKNETNKRRRKFLYNAFLNYFTNKNQMKYIKTKVNKVLYGILIFLFIVGCNKKDIQVESFTIDEKNQTALVEISNNTDTNYYIIHPMLLMSYPTPINEDYIETKIIDGSIKNKQIDSIVCTVYTTEEYCEKEYQHLFRNIVLLPSNSVVSIKYKYKNDEKHLINSKRVIFPYNNSLSDEDERDLLLRNRLDSINPIPNYKFYYEEIEWVDIR